MGSRAPKLTPPDNPLALMDEWSGFHQMVMSQFKPKGRILFIPSCSGDKPYECSPSHRTYRELLDRVAPGMVDKVTLSGILGPVPESMEELVATEYNYNFYLNRYAHLKGQLPQLVDRLVSYMVAFVDRFGGHYDVRVSFCRENYRRVMLLAAKQAKYQIIVLPAGASTALEDAMDELAAALSQYRQ